MKLDNEKIKEFVLSQLEYLKKNCLLDRLDKTYLTGLILSCNNDEFIAVKDNFDKSKQFVIDNWFLCGKVMESEIAEEIYCNPCENTKDFVGTVQFSCVADLLDWIYIDFDLIDNESIELVIEKIRNLKDYQCSFLC